MANINLSSGEVSDCYSTAKSLQSLCLNYVADNIKRYIVAVPDDFSGEVNVRWYVENFVLCYPLSDELLELLCLKKKLVKSVLALFSARNVQLKTVKFQLYEEMIKSIKKKDGYFAQLNEHRLRELDISNSSIKDLMYIINHISNANLLKLRLCPFGCDSDLSPLLSKIMQFTNLIELDVSDVAILDGDLKALAEGMHHLQKLNISRTHVTTIKPLRPIANQLKALLISDVHFDSFAKEIEMLRSFTQLRQLDMSASSQDDDGTFTVDDLLQCDADWPMLASLDLSGTDSHSISEDLLLRFIESHLELQFLGLASTDACKIPAMIELTEQPNATLVVAGSATERQITTSLRTYTQARRPRFVLSCLNALFQFVKDGEMCNAHMLECVLPPLRQYIHSLEVQLAGTACVFYLTANDQTKIIHPTLMADAIATILKSMARSLEVTPKDKQLLKNCLFVICSDYVLDNVRFDHYACADLLLFSLQVDDPTVTRIASNLIGILAGKIPATDNATLVVRHDCVARFLTLISRKLDTPQPGDVTLRMLLTAIWNLTDECPTMCELLIAHDGLKILLRLLLNNLAEVKNIRHVLCANGQFIKSLREYMQAGELEISYFAAGAVANLIHEHTMDVRFGCSDVGFVSVHSLQLDLKNTVESWKEPAAAGPSDDVIVGYRTFRPFIELINCDKEAVQQWALWAVEYVTTRSTERYRAMMAREGDMFTTLLALSTSQRSTVAIRNQAAAILRTYATGTPV